MRIAYVSADDARDVASWSGTPYHLTRALEPLVDELTYVTPLRTARLGLLRLKQVAYRYGAARRHLADRDPLLTRRYAALAEKRLGSVDHDIVLSSGCIAVGHMRSSRPLVLWPDATFASMLGFYPAFSKLSRATVREGHELERKALHRSALAIFSSDWAARSAVEDYETDPAKVHVVPYGANLAAPPTTDAVHAAIDARGTSCCRLLFLAVDWWRKGGDTALKVAGELARAGVPVELTIVGCAPETNGELPEWVRPLGHLGKRSAAGRELFARTLSESHFLLLPARADCTPAAVPEANAFGVPALVSDVGGLSTCVAGGRNGWLFGAGVPAADYAERIRQLFERPADYRALARAARSEFETRLNWPTAVRRMIELVRSEVPASAMR